MLYSAHQSIPGASKGFGTSTYNGKSFDESGAQPSDLSDAQRKFLTEDNVRHVLVTRVQSPKVAARWNNNAHFEQRQNQSHQPLPYPLKFHSRLKADKNYPRCNCTTGSECFGATASE